MYIQTNRNFSIVKNNCMAILPWNDSYSVNIEKIDSQHKVLIDYLNRLYEAMLEG